MNERLNYNLSLIDQSWVGLIVQFLSEKKGIVVGMGLEQTKVKWFLSTPPVYTSDKINYDVDAVKRFDCLNTLEKKRKYIMKNYKDYLYIQTIGVLDAYRSKGHDGKLLHALLLAAYPIQMPLDLETESEENELLYQHFGLKALKTIENVILNDDESLLKMYLKKRA